MINEGSINVYLSRWMNVTGTQYMFLSGWIDDCRELNKCSENEGTNKWLWKRKAEY